MNRRQSIAALGGLVGLSGCLRLSENPDSTDREQGAPQFDGETGDRADGPVPTAAEVVEDIGRDAIDGTWNRFQYDDRNSGFVSDGPRRFDGLAVWWRLRTRERIAFSSPAVRDETVYVASWDGHLYAVDAVTGEVRWRHETGEPEEWLSPIVDGDTVYFGSHDSTVYALNAATGAVRWSYSTNGSMSRGAPVFADDRLYIGDWGHLYALDADTGTPRWGAEYDGPISGVAMSDGVVYAGALTEESQVQAFTTDGERLWSTTLDDGPIPNAVTVDDGTVLVGTMSGTLYALDGTENGAVEWRYATDGQIEGSPGVDGTTVYVGSHDERLHAVDADSGEGVWTYWARGDVRSSPVIVEGVLFVGSSDGHLHALSRRGDLLDMIELGPQVTSSPAVLDDVMYVGSEDYHLYAISIDW